MTKRSTTAPIAAHDPKLTMPRQEASNHLSARINNGKKLIQDNPSTEDEAEEIKASISRWDEFNKTLLSKLFTSQAMLNTYLETYYRSGNISWDWYDWFQNDIKELKDKINKLQSIQEQLELVPVAEFVEPTPTRKHQPQTPTRKVFVVHGHDDGAKEAVARFLSSLDLQPIILHEQANKGQTIIEKIESNSDVDFAVVLLTPDDVGFAKAHPNTPLPRARQNVILELGYFIGKLGRSHVCALYTNGVELPSDYSGIVFTPYDMAGAWKFLLGKELRAAGIQVDLNRL